ncbi:unnamed protein product [Haemonchus placei]|uniref:Uncharacterized protein n=1 Tax=Haemonchus placei TaxID=6290 RepID=A0A0N4VTK8_HAEPC|nr:unnamed protein product [Haemonchus placei]
MSRETCNILFVSNLWEHFDKVTYYFLERSLTNWLDKNLWKKSDLFAITTHLIFEAIQPRNTHNQRFLIERIHIIISRGATISFTGN